MCLLDCGRLMSAPIGDRTRLDAALDALAAVVLVADELGDRSGVVAFDAEIRRRVATGRRNSDAVIGAVFDLEPRAIDSDYELAFRFGRFGEARARRRVHRPARRGRGAFARRRGAGARAAARGRRRVGARPRRRPRGSHRTARTPSTCTAPPSRSICSTAAGGSSPSCAGAGAEVVESAPEHLAAACVRAYLHLKSRAADLIAPAGAVTIAGSGREGHRVDPAATSPKGSVPRSSASSCGRPRSRIPRTARTSRSTRRPSSSKTCRASKPNPKAHKSRVRLRNGAIIGGLTGAAIVAALATVRYRRRQSS